MGERLFVGGEFVESTSDRVLVVESPATEEVIAEVPDASPEDIDRAVQAARKAQREWRRVDALERAKLLHECTSRLEASGPKPRALCRLGSTSRREMRRESFSWPTGPTRRPWPPAMPCASSSGKGTSSRPAERALLGALLAR